MALYEIWFVLFSHFYVSNTSGLEFLRVYVDYMCDYIHIM